jgi:hypothetical protein
MDKDLKDLRNIRWGKAFQESQDGVGSERDQINRKEVTNPVQKETARSKTAKLPTIDYI